EAVTERSHGDLLVDGDARGAGADESAGADGRLGAGRVGSAGRAGVEQDLRDQFVAVQRAGGGDVDATVVRVGQRHGPGPQTAVEAVAPTGDAQGAAQGLTLHDHGRARVRGVTD